MRQFHAVLRDQTQCPTNLRVRNESVMRCQLPAQVMGKAADAIDFIVVHSYPLWNMDFCDYADGKIDFQVLACASSRAVRPGPSVGHVHMQALA